MRKYVYLIALLVSACASPDELRQRELQFTADIEAIGQEGQTGYFACLYDDKLWDCRQAIWNSKPHPHLPGHEKREFLRRYLDAAERRGADHVLASLRSPCGGVTSLDSSLWREGYEAICRDESRYQILRDSGSWRVTPMEGGV